MMVVLTTPKEPESPGVYLQSDVEWLCESKGLVRSRMSHRLQKSGDGGCTDTNGRDPPFTVRYHRSL